jgi:tetratricopeptide (TPR) repeat protein/predicted nucleic acid-binding protein
VIGIGAAPRVERMGVSALDSMVSSFGWAYRDQTVADYGIDGHIEPFDDTDRPGGRLIAVQVKSGQSYFERTDGGWYFRGDQPKKKSRPKKEDWHLQYWLGHVLPVVIVMYDPESGKLYWQLVSEDRVTFTERAWRILIPETQVLDRDAVARLREIANSVPSAKDDPLTVSIRVLPPSAAITLEAAYETAPAGAMRLSRMLAAGRAQPGLTAETALAGQPSWISSGNGMLEAAIGAYANDHGYPQIAQRAFTRSAEYGSADSPRLFTIAALLALTQSDLRAGEQLLSRADAAGGTGLYWEIAHAVLADLQQDNANLSRMRVVLAGASRQDLAAEPTYMLFLGQLAAQRLNFAEAIRWYDDALSTRSAMPGALLGKAEALIAKIGNGMSAVAFRDRLEARELAQKSLVELRRWSGPSEKALEVVLTTHMMIGAFKAAVTLATAASLGGEALDREAASGPVAIIGAQAALALGDPMRAASFAGPVAGTSADKFIQALVLDPGLPEEDQAATWRAALAVATDPVKQRRAVYQLAALGRLTRADLEAPHVAPHFDEAHREVLLARNDAARGDLRRAILTLRKHAGNSPAAAEMLIEVLAKAGQFDEALAECERSITRFGADKIAHDKLNLLVRAGRIPEAHGFAATLLAGPDLEPEQRITLRRRLIDHSASQGEWENAERQARDTYAAHPSEPDFAWGLITAQANQGRLDAAWTALHDLAPAVTAAEWVPLWMDLHLRFGFTESDVDSALDYANQWPSAAAAVFTTLLEGAGHERPDGHPVLPDISADLLARLQRDLAEFVAQANGGPLGVKQLKADEIPSRLRALLASGSGRLDQIAGLVRAGQLPLGALAAAAGRPYAGTFIERTCGTLYACTTDGTAFEQEVSAARAAINRSVVVETSALHLTTLIPDRADKLRAAFTQVLLARPALADINAARKDLARAPGTSYSVSYDSATDSLVLSQTDPVDHQRQRRQAIELDQVARSVSVADLPEDQDSDPTHAAWLTSIDLAAHRDLPLWSDDLALRRVAASRSIPVFGTVALLTALVEEELIADTLRQDVISLVRAGIVELLLTFDELVIIAELDQWEPVTAARYFRRPTTWSSLPTARACLLKIAESVWQHRSDALSAWFSDACFGIMAALPAHEAMAEVHALRDEIVLRIHADERTQAMLDDEIGRMSP